jgi:hypothetical protein
MAALLAPTSHPAGFGRGHPGSAVVPILVAAATATLVVGIIGTRPAPVAATLPADRPSPIVLDAPSVAIGTLLTEGHGPSHRKGASGKPHRSSPPAATIPLWQLLETSYDLRVRLAVRTGRALVDETLTIRNPTATPLAEVDLSILARAFGEFRLDAASVDGQPVKVRATDRANLRLRFPTPLVRSSATVVLRFRVRPSADISSSLQTRTSHAEGITRFGGWFPIVSDGHGLRFPGDSQVTATAHRFRLEVRLDRPAVIAAPGRIIARSARRQVVVLERARDLAFAVSERYETAHADVDGIRVEAYALRAADATRALRSGSAALRTFQEAYGPYPWPRYVLAASPRDRVGNEYPSIVFLGARSMRDRVVVAHETAHQWFYGLVGNDQLREPWLDEALAEFSADHFFGTLPAPCGTGHVTASVYAFPDRRDDGACGGYGDVVYVSGAQAIDAVRRSLGDEDFFAAMRAYVAAHAHGIATSADLIRAWLDASTDRSTLAAVIGQQLGIDALA